MFKNWLKIFDRRNDTRLHAMPVAPWPQGRGQARRRHRHHLQGRHCTTLDPAIGYDWVNWSMIKSLYSRLMDYDARHARPRTHRWPKASKWRPDGLTYTFKLRKGVKFTNGREVIAKDVQIFNLARRRIRRRKAPVRGLLRFDRWV